ncbi:PTH2-domain-containing protein [Calocera cornea HHB12733]|uniref:peptidyl-tRNA hydrolase n=1 Tax=Calocera cornea HHB12733 TaxID=1353952 RepID=A0A165DH57_9BASI|nr:PTH2-domain-containing protein [Calocera cornea HHB12733]
MPLSLSTESWSPMALYTGVAVLAGTVGYVIGLRQRPLQTSADIPATSTEPAVDVPESEAGSVSDDDVSDGDLASVKPGLMEECKLVLVVRSDLGMNKGKIAAQCSHATLACYKALSKSNPRLLKHWERTGQAKIALKCDSEEELLVLQAKAQSLSLCARTIQDAGRTQIAAGSRTVLGIGPAPVRLVNQVTGKLKLL